MEDWNVCITVGNSKAMENVSKSQSGTSLFLPPERLQGFLAGRGGFLSSQNEVLMKEKVPTRELYRKWMDKVGHGMLYYFGNITLSLPKEPAVVDHTPAGLCRENGSHFSRQRGIGTVHAPNPANRYYRHRVHRKGCREVVKAFQEWKSRLSVLAAALAGRRQWKAVLLVAAAATFGRAYSCNAAVEMNTVNFIRTHRRL